MNINVDICVCLSSVQVIEVPENYNRSDLEDYVREQVVLPQEILKNSGSSGWYVDDFFVSD